MIYDINRKDNLVLPRPEWQSMWTAHINYHVYLFFRSNLEFETEKSDLSPYAYTVTNTSFYTKYIMNKTGGELSLFIWEKEVYF